MYMRICVSYKSAKRAVAAPLIAHIGLYVLGLFERSTPIVRLGVNTFGMSRDLELTYLFTAENDPCHDNHVFCYMHVDL